MPETLIPEILCIFVCRLHDDLAPVMIGQAGEVIRVVVDSGFEGLVDSVYNLVDDEKPCVFGRYFRVLQHYLVVVVQ